MNRKAKRRGAGRPRWSVNLDPDPKEPTQLRLEESLRRKAARIGDGSITEGIRRALRAYPDPKEKIMSTAYPNRKARLTASEASRLLATFRAPQEAEIPAQGFSCQFLSNKDFMTAAYVTGGAIHAEPGLSEITIGWEGVDGMDDADDLVSQGYCFDAGRVRNWKDTVRAVKEHLRGIAEARQKEEKK